MAVAPFGNCWINFAVTIGVEVGCQRVAIDLAFISHFNVLASLFIIAKSSCVVDGSLSWLLVLVVISMHLLFFNYTMAILD